MNYLLDRKSRKKNPLTIIFSIVLILILIYFRGGIFSGLSYAANAIFRPILGLGGGGDAVSSVFTSKSSLLRDNEELQRQLLEQEATMANYKAILDENEKLKEILGRKNEKITMVLGSILAKPNQSLYDTLVIDIGTNQNISTGNMVFALGNVPLGYVSEVYPASSKVVLYSNPGTETHAEIAGHDITATLVGRGGGNFEMDLPRDFTPEKGDVAVLPGITPYALAIVETIISDPRDANTRALLVSPVNIQSIKFVQVRK